MDQVIDFKRKTSTLLQDRYAGEVEVRHTYPNRVEMDHPVLFKVGVDRWPR